MTMLKGDIKMALASLRSARWRSLLTTLGIVIGVVSVVTTVSLGEGVKKQVSDQINHLGNDLIIVRPGKTVTRDSSGKITGVNILAAFGSSTLTEVDLATIRSTPNIKVAVPVSLITGEVKTDERKLPSAFLVSTSEDMPQILNQKVDFGDFFGAEDAHKHVAVIGKKVAEQLFAESAPVGKSLQIRGQNFIVRGVFEQFDSNPLAPGSDFNSAIFIPYPIGKEISNNTAQIYEVLAKTSQPGLTKNVVDTLNASLKKNHGDEDDFTILRQDETLELAGSILGLLTNLIAGIAAISLLVGGVGIMNVMLVSVTERTREIGIRKAVGASNSQILFQFLIEAVVLSLWGGLIGVLLSGVINLLLRIFTNLQPIINMPIILLATAVSLVVGVIFGIAPAFRAARKDPIEALRFE